MFNVCDSSEIEVKEQFYSKGVYISHKDKFSDSKLKYINNQKFNLKTVDDNHTPNIFKKFKTRRKCHYL